MKSEHRLPVRWFLAPLLALMLTTVAHAQAPITFQYFYDESGQLVKVVDSTGTVIEYVYDEVGNLLEIKRSGVTGLVIFDFNPKQGPIGTTVTIQGQGFSPTPDENTVTFNGTTATVTSATASTLVTSVPPGATTGPIVVTVGAETATPSQDFVVSTPPVITSVSPRFVLPGETISELRVTGLNLTGSTFSFLPDFALPDGVAIDSAGIDASGTSATLGVTVGTDASSRFVLIATNADGSSDFSASASNTLAVFDTTSANEDADGDGFINGIEAALRSDPFDPNSVPNPSAFITEAVGPIFSLLNTAGPGESNLPGEAVSPIFSIANGAGPGETNLPGEAVGAIFSLLNSAEPLAPGLPGEAVSHCCKGH